MSRHAAAARMGPVWAVVARDLRAVSRSKPVVIPMLVVPGVLLVALPFLAVLGALGSGPAPGVESLLGSMPGAIQATIRTLPANERFVVLVCGYLMVPFFLVVPMMVAGVLAADAFAGEKERRTLESVLHLPIGERSLFYAKVLGAFLPAVAVSWLGFAVFAVVVNVSAWTVVHRVLVPTRMWAVAVLWVAPAVAALGLGVMVRVSARVRTAQEANQLGGAVILPLVFLAVAQSTGLVLLTLRLALLVGAVAWLLAIGLVAGGARRFTRDRLLASS